MKMIRLFAHLVYFFMQYKSKLFVESNGCKSIATAKDLTCDTKVEFNDYWLGAFFSDKYLNISLRHDFTTITLDEVKSYDIPYYYIEINGKSIFYVMPEKTKEVSYFEKDIKIIPQMYGLTIMDWLNKYHNNSIFLKNLYEAVDFIFYSVADVLSSMEDCYKVDYDEIPQEIIDKIKDAFLDYYYDEIFYNTIREYGPEILKDLGLLDEHNGDEDYEDYEDDEDTYYSRHSIDIQKLIDLYETNDEFKRKVDKYVEYELEYNWREAENDEYFIKKKS